MFVTEENPGEAVSAVKALQKASAEGQRIYHVTQANQAEALPDIRQNSLTMQEIRSALAVGKEVIVHTDPISVPGWTGAGYVIFDPEVGDGAWKIGGGGNGAFLEWFAAQIATLMSVFLSILGELAQSGKEIVRFLSRLFEGIGLMLDLADTYEQCAETGNLARAIISTIIIVTYVSVIGVIVASFSVLPVAGTIIAVAIMTSLMTSALLNTMRENVCR